MRWWWRVQRRIVALSDQHGFLPDVPPGDLLIVAGDVCPDRFGPFMARHDPHQQKAWFDQKARPWLASAPATHKLLTWGNHDWCGQACSFRSDSPEHARSRDMQILVDEETTVPIPGARFPCGQHRGRTRPAMGLHEEPGDLEPVYAAIPVGTDILVSHQPPYGYGDRAFDHDASQLRHVGSRELLAGIQRVRPKIVICGHVHGGYGRYEHQGIPIYNVSVVDQRYRLVNPPTVIDF